MGSKGTKKEAQRKPALTIGKVAKQTGVGIETIRFYERNGLINDPPRRASGYRQYPSDTVERIRFIKQAKELGFTLAEVEELLSLKVSPGKTCADVKRKADQKMSDVEAKIKQLGQIRRALQALTKQCTGRGPTSDCPILDALEKEGRKR